MGRNSALSIDKKLLPYNSVLKPIWTYGIQIWVVASKVTYSVYKEYKIAS